MVDWKRTRNVVVTGATIAALLLLISLMVQLRHLLKRVDSILPSVEKVASRVVPIIPKVDEAMTELIPLIPKIDGIVNDIQPIIPNINDIVDDIKHDVGTFDSIRSRVDKVSKLKRDLDDTRSTAQDIFGYY